MGSLWSAVRHRTRRTSLVIVTIVGVASLSGCTVPVVGTTGIGVDASGRLVGYLSICEQHIDGVTLYISDPPQPCKYPTPRSAAGRRPRP